MIAAPIQERKPLQRPAYTVLREKTSVEPMADWCGLDWKPVRIDQLTGLLAPRKGGRRPRLFDLRLQAQRPGDDDGPLWDSVGIDAGDMDTWPRFRRKVLAAAGYLLRDAGCEQPGPAGQRAWLDLLGRLLARGQERHREFVPVTATA